MHNTKAHFFSIALLILYAIPYHAQKTGTSQEKVDQWMQINKGLGFQENKGQMENMQGKPANNLLFKTGLHGADMYITTNGISYVFHKIERHKRMDEEAGIAKYHKHDSISGQYCRADLELGGATIQKENVIREFESEDYTDFYLGGICPDGEMNVHSYGRISIKNIYPGIDWVFTSSKNKGLEYDFVVHPGADPANIKLRYKWTDKPALQQDGSIKIHTAMGSIMEGVPVSYQRIDPSDKGFEHRRKIETSYIVNDNEVTFKIGKYDKSKTLVIDPLLEWATFYGETSDNDVVYSLQDDGSNVWVTGSTQSINFPTQNPGSGAYFQDTLSSSNENIFILKFTTGGVLKWATYYGGSGYNVGYSINCDGTNVWVTGEVASTNFPTYNPGGGAWFQGTFVSNYGVTFVLQFSVSGIRKWATLYEGSGGTNGDDFGNSIQSDGNSVWVTGATRSINFPTYNPSGGAYFQGSLGSPNDFDAYILQFTTSGVKKWATYYGGGSGDVGASIHSDGNNVWVTGSTQSGNFPTYNPGGGAYYQSTIGGGGSNIGGNLFLLKFSTMGVCKWATFYGGSSNDFGNCIQSDGTNVWVTGTAGSPDFPTLDPGGGSYYQGTLGNIGANSFILQFTTMGICKWATYYGGSGADEGISIQSDSNNIWLSGITGSTDFPTLNPGGHSFFQGKLGTGKYSMYILQFNISGVRKWATYYGNSSNFDSFTAYASSDGQNLFVSGNAYKGSTYPLLNPGGGAYYFDSVAFSATNYFYSENLLMAKFCISNNCGPCTLSAVKASSTEQSICAGDSLLISASEIGSIAVNYKWKPGGQTTTSIHVGPTSNTNYIVTVNDSIGGCSTKDSINITVNSNPLIHISGDTAFCIGKQVPLRLVASGAALYLWSTGDTTAKINIAPAQTTQYSVVASNIFGCTAKDSTTIAINPLPIVSIIGNQNICIGSSSLLTASGGNAYLWNTGVVTDTLRISPGFPSYYSVNAVNSNGCASRDSILINLLPLPVVSVGYSDTIMQWSSIQLKATGGLSYTWVPSSGLNDPYIDNPIANPNSTTTYVVYIKDANNCVANDTVTVFVKDINCGNVFVPSAFSPNGDGQNDVLYIRSQCIQSFDFAIFNRWGEKVFETTNLTNGWDGKFKGQSCNVGAFVYYVKGIMFDGIGFEKTGNVTLVR